jgi:hypothetical protein
MGLFATMLVKKEKPIVRQMIQTIKLMKVGSDGRFVHLPKELEQVSPFQHPRDENFLSAFLFIWLYSWLLALSAVWPLRFR